MAALLESLLQTIWNIDSWAEKLTLSGPLTLTLVISQVAGAMLILRQLKRLGGRQQLMGLSLILGINLLGLTITPLEPGWLLLAVPTGLALSAGYTGQGSVRWGARILWIGAAGAALILGEAGVAAIVSTGLGAWLLGYLSRRIKPRQAAPLAAENRHNLKAS